MKLLINICLVLSMESRPARGAWIEISTSSVLRPKSLVAPRTGRVD